MAEGLGLAAGVIAVLQITSSVLSVCYDYNCAAKDAPWELSEVVAEMESLRDVLQTLEPLAKHAEFADPSAATQLPTLTLLCGPQGLLQHCLDDISRLDERLKSPRWSDGFGPKRKAFIQALRWPFNKAETKEALVKIGRFKDTFTLAITGDKAALILSIQGLSSSTNHIVLGTQKDVRLIKDTVSALSRDVQSTNNATLAIHRGMEQIERERIYSWLSAPDPSTNHTRASHSRQEKTGLWFLKSETFTQWKDQSSLVWLHGKAGCGKTVLSSTIVNEVLQESQSKSDVAVAYFYFDFSDLEKRKSDKMIRSLITQLFRQSTKDLGKLQSLFSSYNNGERQPDVKGLMIALKELVESFGETYIVLDALDECIDTEDLLEFIREVRNWQLRQLHMLATSRRLVDIEDSLKSLINHRNRICIPSALVDLDILTYVHARLQNDRKLKRWENKPKVQEEIEVTLMRKADGMFRWAVCQLDVLRNCFNLPMLRKALETLPSTLDETYARMLCSIPEEHSDYALTFLQWLTYSARPLRLMELAEVVAVKVDGSPWFDCDDRFDRPQRILAICSSLVTLEDVRTEEDDQTGEEDDQTIEDDDSIIDDQFRIVRLAHFSVKEYLVSERVRNQAAAKYSIQEIQANQSIAAACLAYLLQFDQHNSLTSRTVEEFPLANYAAKYWMDHTRMLGKNLDVIKTLIPKFCQVHSEAYTNWYRLHDHDIIAEDFRLNKKLSDIATALYYGSLAGVTELVQLLLENGAAVNAMGGDYGSALQAASAGGHHTVVQLLLENEANVNAKGGHYGSALQAASKRGHHSLMQLLLENGADVNAMEGYYGSALQAASAGGHYTVVQLLLENEANVNAKGGRYGSALQAASFFGYNTVVQLLLENEANVNAKGGPYGSALQAASFFGYHTVVQLLLENGADANAMEGDYGNALQAASAGGHHTVVQLLLEKGAAVNAMEGHYGNALQAASFGGHHTVVQLLLKKRAAVNAMGGQYGSALQAASAGGHHIVVQLLLENGAAVNAMGGHYGSALQAASAGGHHTVVQLLLENEANVNAMGGDYGSALQAASAEGHHTVVQLLLENRADVDAKGGYYGSALQAASAEGHHTVVQLLLENGADVRTTGERYGSALQVVAQGSRKYYMSKEKREEIVQLQSAMESQAPPASSPTADESAQLI